MAVDTRELTRQWDRLWPGCPPIGHVFRRRMHDRWVRFHTLPLGKRYPTSVAESRETLTRYNAVMSAIVSASACATIYLVTVDYGPTDLASGTEPVHVGLHPGAVPWMTAADPDDSEAVYGLHVSRQTYVCGDLDDLLCYVAEDRTSDVWMADGSLGWLFHPYDGGMDVIAPTVADRDRLARRFVAWLSERPDGL